LNQTGPNEWADVEGNDVAIREVVNGELDNENIRAGANIAGSKLADGTVTAAKLAASVGKITWYTPKVIASEQSVTNESFAFLPTEDKIEGVVVPENGLILVAYRALVKQTTSEAGRAAIFLGNNQLKGWTTTTNAVENRETEAWTGSNFVPLYSDNHFALKASSTTTTGGTPVTTGFLVGMGGGIASGGGFAVIEAAAGTYTVGVKYRAIPNSVTAKERKLWVATLG
jgi:hypothetical protein